MKKQEMARVRQPRTLPKTRVQKSKPWTPPPTITVYVPTLEHFSFGGAGVCMYTPRPARIRVPVAYPGLEFGRY